MLPPGQSLEADDLARRQAHDRLIANLELPARDRADQVRFQRQRLVRRSVQLRPEGRVAALPGALGVVHRGVGLAKETRAAGTGPSERDADTRPRKDLRALDDDRLVETLEQPARNDLGLRGVDPFEKDGELVAPEPCNRVRVPHGLPQAAGDTDEELVPGGVSQAVVDGLEVVDVDEQDGHPQERPPRPLERVRDAVEEQRAVRERRERVVEGLMRELLLELASLRHVMARDDEPAHAGIGEEVADNGLEPAPRTVSPARAELERAVAGRARRSVERGLDRRTLLGVEKLGELGADQLLRLEPEHGLHRRGQVGELTLVVEDGDQVGRVLDERPEARLTPPRRTLFDQLDALDRVRDLRGEPFEAPDVVGSEAPGRDCDLADANAVDDDGEAAALESAGRQRLVAEHDPRVAPDEPARGLGGDLLQLVMGAHGCETGGSGSHHVLALDGGLLQLEHIPQAEHHEDDQQHGHRDRGQHAQVAAPNRLDREHRRGHERQRDEPDQPGPGKVGVLVVLGVAEGSPSTDATPRPRPARARRARRHRRSRHGHMELRRCRPPRAGRSPGAGRRRRRRRADAGVTDLTRPVVQTARARRMRATNMAPTAIPVHGDVPTAPRCGSTRRAQATVAPAPAMTMLSRTTTRARLASWRRSTSSRPIPRAAQPEMYNGSTGDGNTRSKWSWRAIRSAAAPAATSACPRVTTRQARRSQTPLRRAPTSTAAVHRPPMTSQPISRCVAVSRRRPT